MLFDKISQYWDKRSDSFSEQTQADWTGDKKNAWQTIFRTNFPKSSEKDLHVLDLGCGPGAFSILCADMGCQVTAVDGSRDMLNTARANCQKLPTKHPVKFIEANVDAPLPFENGTFDAIVMRNVVWNLTQPEHFYKECYRLLKKGGALLVFDGNWYLRLFDKTFEQGYLADRAAMKARAWEDDSASNPTFAIMENIARELPLSKIKRPQWDKETLTRIGFSTVHSDENIYKKVWDEKQQVSCGVSPLFMVHALK